MVHNIGIGITGECELVVKDSDTALQIGSGSLEVFATPAMIALMEKTCAGSISQYLQEGLTTVGTAVNIKHIKATRLDQQVKCRSELIEFDGKKLVFSVRAFDEKGEIGNGIHERYIVDAETFMSKI